MRAGFLGLLLLTACGPSERESMDPGILEREAIAQGQARNAASDGARHGTVVRCACDADGGLHVQAPADARVTATGPGAAEIAFDDAPPRRPIRTTISLGYIGDNPLTPNASYGGPWNAPDGVLPPHPIYWNYDPWYHEVPMHYGYPPHHGYRR